MAVRVEQALLVGALHRIGYGLLELGDPVLELAKLRGGGDNLLKRGVALTDAGLLLEIAHGSVLRKGDGAFVGGLLPHDDLEQRGLAGSVRADESPTLACVELHRGARIERPTPEGLAYLVDECNQLKPLVVAGPLVYPTSERALIMRSSEASLR